MLIDEYAVNYIFSKKLELMYKTSYQTDDKLDLQTDEIIISNHKFI